MWNQGEESQQLKPEEAEKIANFKIFVLESTPPAIHLISQMNSILLIVQLVFL